MDTQGSIYVLLTTKQLIFLNHPVYNESYLVICYFLLSFSHGSFKTNPLFLFTYFPHLIRY